MLRDIEEHNLYWQRKFDILRKKAEKSNIKELTITPLDIMAFAEWFRKSGWEG